MYGVWQQAAKRGIGAVAGSLQAYPKQKAGKEYGRNC